MKIKHLIFPFKYEQSLIRNKIEYLTIVKVTSDFGEFMKGEIVKNLAIDYKENRIEKQDETGETLRSQSFKLIAE